MFLIIFNYAIKQLLYKILTIGVNSELNFFIP